METKVEMNENTQEPNLSEESGRALPWPVFLCLVVSIAYLMLIKEHVEHNSTPLLGTIILCVLVIANVFALGCSIQLLFIGGESNRFVRKNLRRQAEDLRKLVDSAQDCLSSFETDLGKTKIQLSARGIDTLALLRRVTNALDSRLGQIEYHLKRGSRIDLIDADELFRRQLLVEENAVSSIINASGGLPPIPPEEWASTITALIGEVIVEQRMTA